MNLRGHHAEIRCVIQLADGKLVSGSDDSTMMIWDLTSWRHLATCEGHSSAINCALQLADGRLVSGSDDLTLKFWNILSV